MMSELLVVIPIAGFILAGAYALWELLSFRRFDKANTETMERIAKTQEWLSRMERPATLEQPVYPPLDHEGDETPVRVFPYPVGLVRIPKPCDVTPGEVWK